MSLRTFLPVFDFSADEEMLFFFRILPSFAFPFILLILFFICLLLHFN